MGNFSSLLAATGLAVTVAMPSYAQDADTVLATVDGTDITLGHVIILQDRLPDGYKRLGDAELYQGILEQLIRQTILAKEMENVVSREVALGLELQRTAFLAEEFVAQTGSSPITEEDVRALYETRYGNIQPDEEFNASHILVETEETALELIAQLEAGADFATLAKENSTGPSGPRGGELGWFGKGQMVPAFEEAVIGLEDGGVSAPVQTQFGWHVVKRNDSRNKTAPDLEEVRADLENAIRSEAVDEAVNAAVDQANITRTEVEIDPALIRKVELLSE
jgi:peptidyl-prolyl cis-trans isomerase C